MPGDIGSLSAMTQSSGFDRSRNRYTEYEWKVIRSKSLALEEELNNLSLNGRWEVFSVTPVAAPSSEAALSLNACQRERINDFVIVARR